MLTVYSVRDLQMFTALVSQAKENGWTVDQIEGAVQAEIAARLHPADANESPNRPISCPSCQNGIMIPTPNPEGLQILTCLTCRYSKLKGVSDE